MKTIQNCQEMQNLSLDSRCTGKTIAFVPTMGALHEGHLTLVDAAKKSADIVVLSIFVNPTQFGPTEDFDQYPRNLNRDAGLAEERGVDFLFTPTVEEIYPPGDQTAVVVTELSRGLCGPLRPGHFRGVATVVLKLFNLVQPNFAFFGEKDYQQLKIIERLVRDLHLPLKIIGVPTLREASGLALSSRNAYLSEEEKASALKFPESLQKGRELFRSGERDAQKIIRQIKAQLEQVPDRMVEYVEIVDCETLQDLALIDRPARLIAAIRIHGKRLIDNILLD